MIFTFNCKNCQKEMTMNITPSVAKVKKFCSKKCLAYHNSLGMSDESKAKLSKSKTKEPIETTCKYCNKTFMMKRKKTFCDNTCSALYRSKSKEYLLLLSVKGKLAYKEGRLKGWKTRKKLEPSHPEKVVMGILDELKIDYEREHPHHRWFIDFAFLDKKIALEIDGKQHDFPQRKESDLRKDYSLKSEGWIVYRIRWKKISKEFYQELKNKISNILSISETLS
jgi:very-short-patch-repair endonuclease